MVERFHGKEEVSGSIPEGGSVLLAEGHRHDMRDSAEQDLEQPKWIEENRAKRGSLMSSDL